MANFALGASPAFSTFRSNFGFGQTAMSSIIAEVWPYDDTSYDISAMSSYRNQNMFRYTVNSNNSSFGTIRVFFPFDSLFQTSYTTPWFRVGNPPYITIQAYPIYPRVFTGWRTDPYNTTLVTTSNPTTISWNASSYINITAIFA
jgi:hypothetical protein